MNGTLALWFEPFEQVATVNSVETQADLGATLKPKLELHLNLWRDPPAGFDFLDIGLKLENVHLLSRFYILLPFLIDKKQLHDLSEVMKFSQTLEAVFNTVVEIDGVKDLYYTTKSKGSPFVTVHTVDVKQDVRIDAEEDNATQSYCTLTFSQHFCERLRSSPNGAQYLRFRIKLTGSSGSIFTQEVSSKDRLFVSSTNKLELTELRLNEQRSFPSKISQRAQQNSFEIVRVHYFLIRDLGHELVAQHAPLRKVRRLEPDLWASYMRGVSVRSNAADRERRIAERLIIYHWREGDGKTAMEDFTAFATFRTSTPGLIFYIIAIVLLGAVGSSLSAIATAYVGISLSIALFALCLFLLWLTTLTLPRWRNVRAKPPSERT